MLQSTSAGNLVVKTIAAEDSDSSEMFSSRGVNGCDKAIESIALSRVDNGSMSRGIAEVLRIELWRYSLFVAVKAVYTDLASEYTDVGGECAARRYEFQE